MDLVGSVKKALSTLHDSEPDQVPGARIAMHHTKAAVVADVVQCESGMVADVLPTQWLSDLIRRYEGWLARLSPL